MWHRRTVVAADVATVPTYVYIHWVILVVGSTGEQFVDNQNNNNKKKTNQVLSRPETYFQNIYI